MKFQVRSGCNPSILTVTTVGDVCPADTGREQWARADRYREGERPDGLFASLGVVLFLLQTARKLARRERALHEDV